MLWAVMCHRAQKPTRGCWRGCDEVPRGPLLVAIWGPLLLPETRCGSLARILCCARVPTRCWQLGSTAVNWDQLEFTGGGCAEAPRDRQGVTGRGAPRCPGSHGGLLTEVCRRHAHAHRCR